MTADPGPPRIHLEETLLRELQDIPIVKENSTARGELRASAVFRPELREQPRAATLSGTNDTAELIRGAQRHGSVVPEITADDAAERLTGLIEALSMRCSAVHSIWSRRESSCAARLPPNWAQKVIDGGPHRRIELNVRAGAGHGPEIHAIGGELRGQRGVQR